MADVGSSLIELLRREMPKELVSRTEQIGLASPTNPGDLRLSLFLYNVRESEDFRRTEMINRGNGDLQYPPMSLTLYYLLTTYSKAESQSQAMDEQRLLGKAMQIFYDNSKLKKTYLQGNLAESNEEIKIVHDNLNTDVLIKLWNFPNTPYKLSVSYAVGPVYLNSERKKQTKRVRTVDFNIKGN